MGIKIQFKKSYQRLVAPVTKTFVRAIFDPWLYVILHTGNGSEDAKIDGTDTNDKVVPRPAKRPEDKVNNAFSFTFTGIFKVKSLFL